VKFIGPGHDRKAFSGAISVSKTGNGMKALYLIASLMVVTSLAGCQSVGLLNNDTAKSTAESETPPKTEEVAPPIAPEKLAAEEALANPEPELELPPYAVENPIFSLRPPSVALNEQAVRIAILLPLSGRHQKIGNDLLKSAYMAMFDQSNKQLRLQPYDTAGTPEGATAAAEKAVREGAEIILGPLFAHSVRAVQIIAAQADINVLAFSTDATVAGNGVYLMGLTPQQQIQRVMEFAYRQGIANFAVLAPQTPYGDRVVSSIEQTTNSLGLYLTRVSRYPADLAPGSEQLQEVAKDIANYEERAWLLKQEINKFKNKKDPTSKAMVKKLSKLDTIGEVTFEALILPEGGQKLRELAPLLSYYDIDPRKVKFIGTGLWADRNLATEPSLVGGWFAAPTPEPARQFLSRFNQTFGYTPPRISSLAYDALALAGLLASEGGEDKFGAIRLEDADGFAGYNGIFRFSANGLAERGLAVMTIGQSDLELLEEAPGTFTPLIN
jgi:Periplasmic binding protein